MKRPSALLLVLLAVLTVGAAAAQRMPKSSPGVTARDPGVRRGSPGAGGPLDNVTESELRFFTAGQDAFQELEGVAKGLGPRFNLDSCAGCHAQPAVGGTSPSENPQVAVATSGGATNIVPFFILPNGPVREARFIVKPDGTPDGGVHDLYTIRGRSDASPDCRIDQPDFVGQARYGNVIFRIPTPVFGAGLIEAIPDSAILANLAGAATGRAAMGIGGRPNRHGPGRVATSGSPNTSGNDGSITRFGWKAQNKSLVIFAAEAYNVEMGVTNELFPTERDETRDCALNATPEDHTNLDATSLSDGLSDAMKFALFMRFLAPPVPAPDTPSIARGRSLFARVGCALCHTPMLMTGPSSSAAFNEQSVNLFSDLLLHQMGPNLADGIVQGGAGPDEFRTAPLWGLGQRIFLLHDGRTNDLVEAIEAHASRGNAQYPPSEANAVIARFQALERAQKQDLLNFLRSL